MATVPLESDKHVPPVTALDSNLVRRPLMPAIRWGAILAGVIVGISVQLALTLLGIAIGLTSTDIAQGEMPGIGSLLWAGLGMLAAAFVGSYVAARMSGLKRRADGMLHGLVTWAMTTLLFAALATSAAGIMLNNLFGSMMPELVQSGKMQESSAPDNTDPVQNYLDRQLGEDMTLAQQRRLLRHIQTGDRDAMVNYLVQTMKVPQLRAENIADQALLQSTSSGVATPRAKAEAQRAAGMANMAAWIVFSVVAFSMGLGIIGGAMGAHGARRTTWSATTDTQPPS